MLPQIYLRLCYQYSTSQCLREIFLRTGVNSQSCLITLSLTHLFKMPLSTFISIVFTSLDLMRAKENLDMETFCFLSLLIPPPESLEEQQCWGGASYSLWRKRCWPWISVKNVCPVNMYSRLSLKADRSYSLCLQYRCYQLTSWTLLATLLMKY